MKTLNAIACTAIFFLFGLMFCSCSIFFSENKVTTFFVDAENGNDQNIGTSAQQAWQTLERASKANLKPGDSLLLNGGQKFNGFLTLDSLTGTPEMPIVISSFGDGRATIKSGNTIAVHISNSRYIEVSNLILIGSGRKDGNDNNGIEFRDVQYGSINNLEVSGYLHSGVKVTGGSDISITHVFAHNNGFSGIFVDIPDFLNNVDKPIRNIYIAYCRAENNPGSPVSLDNHSGSGILIGGVTNGIIEYCEAAYNGWDMPRPGNGPVGIWAYWSDSIIIQHCFAYHNMTSETGHDGGGFDFDGGVTNSILQYNLSALNEGAGYGMYQYIDASVWENNIVRYNISYFDGKKNGKAGIHIWTDRNNPVGIIQGLHAHNNTIINRAGYGINFEPGHYEDFVFENNLILLKGNARQFIAGNFSGATFNNNLYWSEKPSDRAMPPFAQVVDASLLLIDPRLLLPPADEPLDKLNAGLLKTIEYFRPKNDSPALGAGKKIKNPGNTDFWGNALLDGNPVNIGAFQGDTY